MRANNTTMPRPFLKWAGGKGQLLDELRQRYENAAHTGRYHEPFVGGGAFFFDLCRRNLLGRRKALLSDTNERLIETYQAIRDDAESVIALLKKHKEEHSRNAREYYYRVRAHVPGDPAARAARIIYLNRTCFNGLYRENSRGEFNVPIGKYSNPRICGEDNLRAVADALNRKTKIEQRSFQTVVGRAQAGDFVYFDPPYHPLSETASFTSYARNGFTESDQRQLAAVYAELDAKGVRVLLSNSDTPLIEELYREFTIEKVYATRKINSRASSRGAIHEILVRNF
jgi:DNA adenine methylase